MYALFLYLGKSGCFTTSSMYLSCVFSTFIEELLGGRPLQCEVPVGGRGQTSKQEAVMMC